MLALTSSVVSAAVVAGAVIGGLLIDGPGFAALGLACAIVGLLSTAIVLLFVTEEPIDLETQVA